MIQINDMLGKLSPDLALETANRENQSVISGTEG
jgi:hypothetical protein